MKSVLVLAAVLASAPMFAGADPVKKTLNCKINDRADGPSPGQSISKVVEVEGSDDSAFLIAEHETTALNGTVKILLSGFQGQQNSVQPFDSVVIRLEDLTNGVVMISSGRGFLLPIQSQNVDSAFVNYTVADPKDSRRVARQVLVECKLE